MKAWRQSQILDLVDRAAVSSQEVLRQKLKERGIDATQATLSRDLKELGLVKRAGDGAYTRPGNERGSQAVGEQLRKALASLVRAFERVDTLMIVRTDPGLDGTCDINLGLRKARKLLQTINEMGLPAGTEIIRELGLRPGPMIGRLLSAIQEAQATGQVASRAQALQFARERAKNLVHEDPQSPGA